MRRYIWTLFKKCFPTKCVLQRDPFMSLIIKHLLKQRKKAIKRNDIKTSHRLQEKINQLIRKNQLRAVNQNYKNKLVDRKDGSRW